MREIGGDLIDEVDVRSLANERQETALPEPGEQVIFAGTCSEQSESGNFTFEGCAGPWVAIIVYSRGLVEPRFRLRGPAGLTRCPATPQPQPAPLPTLERIAPHREPGRHLRRVVTKV